MSIEVATNYTKELSARVQIFMKIDYYFSFCHRKTKFDRKRVFQILFFFFILFYFISMLHMHLVSLEPKILPTILLLRKKCQLS